MRCFLGLGSNLGDRLANMQAAVECISQIDKVIVMKSSSVYETEPWGNPDQPLFYNSVLDCDADFHLESLLPYLKKIERQLGRQNTEKYSPRIIDIDVLFYGTVVRNMNDVVVPHPHIQDRKFVLIPLCDVAPEFIHPLKEQSISQLLANCADTCRVFKTQLPLHIR